jgi:hypothetical protein
MRQRTIRHSVYNPPDDTPVTQPREKTSKHSSASLCHTGPANYPRVNHWWSNFYATFYDFFHGAMPRPNPEP